MTANNPMTEGEALAVEAFQNAMEAEYGYRPQVFATGVLMNSRDADRYEGWKLALTAHTAASGGEVVAWINYEIDITGGEDNGRTGNSAVSFRRYATGYDYANATPLYTAPPAAVPADALTDEAIERALDTRLGLDHTLRQLIRGDTAAVGYGKTDVVRALLAALIPKGAV